MNSSFFRAARQMGLGASVFLVFGALALNWNRISPLIAPRFEDAARAEAAKKRAQESAGYDSPGYDSLARSLEKLDSQTLRQWVNALTGDAKIGQKPRVSIAPGAQNPRELARFHPAWLLAQRLERGAVLPAAPRALAVSPRTAGVDLGAQTSLAAAQQNREIAASRLRVTSELSGVANAQNGALDAFNRDWNARQEAIRRADEFARERELEDQIREQTRAQVQLIALQTVPPDVALELANLRLQLLRTLALSPAQREQARARIAQIEERLQEIWRAQTAEQERILIESLEISPARLRREGIEKIRAEMRELAARDLKQRQALIGEIETLIARDLGRAQSAALELFLPPATLPRELSPTFFEQLAAREASGENVLPTAIAPLSRFDYERLAQIGAVSRSQIERLRQVALRDARIWSETLALRTD